MILKLMEIPSKRLNNGFELPVYGLGLAGVGGGWAAETGNDKQEIATIQTALELGVSHFDTAEGYGHGHSEELLGVAMRSHDRSRLTIATKVSPHNQSYFDLIRSAEASLGRLQTDYIDLYMLHRYPNEGIPIADTMASLGELVSRGLVRHIGVSNMTPAQFTALQDCSEVPLVCNQVQYNVQHQEVAEPDGVLEHCRKNDALLVAYRPLLKGNLPRHALLSQIAYKYGKTVPQIAINWLISQTGVVTVAKTSSVRHLKENLGATDWVMDPVDIERIQEGNR